MGYAAQTQDSALPTLILLSDPSGSVCVYS